MPILFAIINKEHDGTHGVEVSLRQACQKAKIEYRQLIAEDIALDSIANIQFEQPALLYRISTKVKAATIESMLVLLHPQTFTTIYYPKLTRISSRPFRELAEQMAAGLPIIPTAIVDETWQELDESKLNAKVQPLGGFPIILKTLGLSHGVGVKKIDAISDLQRQLQAIVAKEPGTIIRKYLSDYRHYRIIIINDAAVAVIEYHQPIDDFRTNAQATPLVSPVALSTVSAQIIATARSGVRLRASLLGGVDILVDQSDNTPYLAEVNVPCYFARAEGPTGIDISGQLIDAMLIKQKKEQSNG